MTLQEALEHSRSDGCSVRRRSQPGDLYRVSWPDEVQYSYCEGRHWWSLLSLPMDEPDTDDWECASGCATATCVPSR